MHAASNVVLLDNTRKIEKLIHNNDTGKVVFNDICRVMSDILHAHILVISKKGKVLGVGECSTVKAAHDLIEEEIGTFVDPELNSVFWMSCPRMKTSPCRRWAFSRAMTPT